MANTLYTRFLLANYWPFLELTGHEAECAPRTNVEILKVDLGKPRQILAATLDTLVADLQKGGMVGNTLLRYFAEGDVALIAVSRV